MRLENVERIILTFMASLFASFLLNACAEKPIYEANRGISSTEDCKPGALIWECDENDKAIIYGTDQQEMPSSSPQAK